MSKKTERVRPMDLRRGAAGTGEVLSEAGSILPPAIPLPAAPEDLTVGTMTIGRASQGPIAIVPLSWRPPGGVPVPSYLVEVADDSGFTSVYLRATAIETSVEVQLPSSRTFYARVYAQAGSGRQSGPSNVVSFTTPADTTPAGPPTSASGGFIGSGDLDVSWTNPASENFRDVEVRIWESSSKTTLLHTGYAAGGRFIWTAAQNRQAGSGTPDPSVYVELRSRTWAGVLGTAVVVGTITKTAPATPGSAAADFSGPDCVFTWNAVADAAFYRLTIDGTARTVAGTRYVYSFDLNRQEHGGTADPSVSWSLVAVDGLDQVSASAATGTATNAAPAAPASVTLNAGFSAFMASVTATEPADFATYRWRIIQTNPSASDITYDSPATLQTREVTAQATYQVGVRMVDVFGQQGNETLSSTAALDALTLADLRADASYRDSVGTSASTLNALKDAITASGGITYNA